ncbi:IS21 family transposase [Novosphingobium sp. NBM11]|jgi:transposase/stage V sporulation protein SpoVS|uniref:IS21 family transposase n=1 Tax=Sphingobium yanoikuyae TaxID=13690 RepID=A0A430BEM3_SPHYA|nr:MULTISPECIES: IS21 family transposase [Sphingomonadaceae]HDB8235852.1 IS21 family transposase [Staphylococcus aureus]HOB15201.1 IS21 family transposase [Novosphingobium sp.]MBF5089463.1 IS21 family transposase [Novosphingobium sp. NBM11]MBF5089837.1 IS21 family transposase [Novosphingobium sp. NBM11]MBF5091092.1 IS21 family transposase [Novosphingobium sp. NBM11]
MYAVEVYASVRQFVFVQGRSQREAARVFGLSRETIGKICRFSLPPGYTRTKPVEKPKLGPLLPVVDAILEGDRTAPVKQRHTAKRIFERLRDEYGYGGGYTVVKDYVRLSRVRGRETFVPLAHPPGHAQVDFGEAVGVIGGVEQKIHFLCMDLPQSDACFVKAFPRETTEAFLDGHVSAFDFFGGIPQSILYDNTTIAVAKILGDGKRERTRAFSELVSHYLFSDRFGRPGKGNDKGKVEGLVKYARRNFMTPKPQAASYDALNAALLERCHARQGERAGRHAQTIGERMVADVAALRPLPPVPLEPCERRSARVSSTALVRYRGNDYSVPTRFGFQDVVVKGFVDEVVILSGAEEIARHVRSYGSGDFVADPLHYLALIETKPNALDQAAALQNWALPDVFAHLRQLLEGRMGRKGKREYIQVLRLLEAMPMAVVTHAVTQAIHMGAISFDAVKQIALARMERRPARLDLTTYPHLPRLDVKVTQAADYAALMPQVSKEMAA